MATNQNPFASMFGFGGRNPFDFGDDDEGSADNPEFNFGGKQEFDNLKQKVSAMSKKALVGTAILIVVVLAAAYWWFHPPINIHSVDLWFFVSIFILLPLFLFLRGKQHAYKKGTGKVAANAGKATTFRVLSFVPVVIFGLVLVGALLSASFFPGNAHKYASILDTTNMEFTQDIQEVNYSEIPVIDRASAVLLGNRTMGAMSDLVSQFEISTLYSQINYRDRPVRVSPLMYADLFKWLQNRIPGIPAYVIVDMTTQDAQVVRLDDEHAIKYSASEPLVRNIDRYVQLKYPFYMFGEKSFEIDDEGNAWWICPVRDFTIGLFGGETICRAVLVNAATGECQDLGLDEVPGWVDRVYPSDLLITQFNWRGAYSSGWLNSWLGQNGVVQTTPGTNYQLGYNYIAKDDDVWMYTGVTSATSDNSIVGFVLVNQRTAESHFYSVAGATEDSAMMSAEGQVQNLRYSATFPILINVSNTPTYFMALKDAAGLVKKYAMVDIERYQNVAVGDTVADTQKAYLALLVTNGAINPNEVDTSSFMRAEGVIKTVAQGVIDGNSHFYVTLQGDSNIYDFALPAMVEIVSFAVGDTIEFSYLESAPTCIAQEILGGSHAEAAAAQPATQAAATGDDAAVADSAPAAAGQGSEASAQGADDAAGQGVSAAQLDGTTEEAPQDASGTAGATAAAAA